VAKKTLMSFREWQRVVTERKARHAARRAAAKQAKLEAWWAIPAERNYVEISASWLGPDTPAHISSYGVLDNPIGPEGMCVSGRVLPDKRRGRNMSKLRVSLTVPGDADRDAIARHLLQLATCLLASEEPWRTATGAPLARPVTVEGMPIRVVPPRQWTPTHTSPPPTGGTPTAPTGHASLDLATLRARLQGWLSAHRTEDSVLALLTVEQVAEVVLMRVCGDDIALVSERDPWRWDHTAEEIRAAEAALADEVQTLSALVTDLNRRLGPEAAIEVLLTVFVQGQSAS
jgi:hypothetical protein